MKKPLNWKSVLKDQQDFISRKSAFFFSEPNPEKLLGKHKSGNVNTLVNHQTLKGNRVTGEGASAGGRCLPGRQTSFGFLLGPASYSYWRQHLLMLQTCPSSRAPFLQHFPSPLCHLATWSLQGTNGSSARRPVPPMGHGT